MIYKSLIDDVAYDARYYDRQPEFYELDRELRNNILKNYLKENKSDLMEFAEPDSKKEIEAFCHGIQYGELGTYRDIILKKITDVIDKDIKDAYEDVCIDNVDEEIDYLKSQVVR